MSLQPFNHLNSASLVEGLTANNTFGGGCFSAWYNLLMASRALFSSMGSQDVVRFQTLCLCSLICS
jgi:hypothetical protein